MLPCCEERQSGQAAEVELAACAGPVGLVMVEHGRLEPSDPRYWNGTLLKCTGCRTKFPFSAAAHPFEYREDEAGPPSVVRPRTPTTRCPHCDGWVPIT